MCLAPFPGQCIYHKCSIFTPQVPSLIPRPVCISIYAGRTRVIEQDYPCMHPTNPINWMLPGENLCVSPHAVSAITTTRPGCDSKLPQSYLQSGEITCTLHHLNRTAGYENPPPMGTRCYQVCILFLVSQPVKME